MVCMTSCEYYTCCDCISKDGATRYGISLVYAMAKLNLAPETQFITQYCIFIRVTNIHLVKAAHLKHIS